MILEEFLCLVDRGRAVGGGEYSFCCPGPLHENGDSHPSAVVRAGEKGLLLHCYAGCTAADITGALGLSLKDLFYEQNAQPRKWGRWAATELLEMIRHETIIVSIAAEQLAIGNALVGDDLQRVREASEKIRRVVEVIHS